jgi:hypothetical protein
MRNSIAQILIKLPVAESTEASSSFRSTIIFALFIAYLAITGHQPAFSQGDDAQSTQIIQAVRSLGGNKDSIDHDFQMFTENTHLATKELIDELHPIARKAYYPAAKTRNSEHVIYCLRALRYLTGITFAATTKSKLTEEEKQFLNFNKEMYDFNPDNKIHFFSVWMSRDAYFVAPLDAQKAIIDQWKHWRTLHAESFPYLPSKSPADAMGDWYWYG